MAVKGVVVKDVEAAAVVVVAVAAGAAVVGAQVDAGVEATSVR